MYFDYYLRFNNEAEANAILYTVTDEVTDEEGAVVQEASTKPNYDNIDILGIIYEDQPIPDPENPPEPIAIDGWHVNVRTATESPELNTYAVVPTNPRRVWA